jgi:hypothetical protein
MSKHKILILLIFTLLFCFKNNTLHSQNSTRMWASLEFTASETACFSFNLPNNGCVSFITNVPGRKQIDRIWGPRYMKKGAYKLRFPASRIINRQGFIELFNIEIEPDLIIGTRGNGERQFVSPRGLDWDENRKELFVADTGNDRIIRLNGDGRFIASHGGFGLTFGDRAEEREDSLDSPYDVTSGGFSDFYISDQNNYRICIFDSYHSYKGNLYPADDSRRNRLDRPRGIKNDYENNLWLVDGRADKVIKISFTGDKLLEIGGFGYSSLQLKDPTQVDVNIHGEIFIADRGNGRIAIFDRLGSFKKSLKNHLKSPCGVAIDPDGLIIICDDQTNELGLYTSRGTRLAYLNKASDQTQFRRPSDIAVNDNYIFVADSGNHRILRFKRNKTRSLVPWQAKSTVLE